MHAHYFFAASFAVLFSSIGFSQNTKSHNETYPNDEIPFFYKDGIKYSQKYRTPLVLSGISDEISGRTPEEKSMNWITSNLELLKVTSTADLIAYATRNGAAGSTVRFRQSYQGVPVFLSEIVVHISPKNRVTYVTNTYDPTIQSVNTIPSLSDNDALTFAEDHIDARGHKSFTSADLMIYNRGEKTKLIYKVIIEAESPSGSWEVLVDAQTGEIIRAADKACTHKGHEELAMPVLPPPTPVNGIGNVFIPDPLTVAQVSYGSPYSDNSDATNASLDATMTSVTLLDIDFDGVNYNLAGPYAEVKDFESPYKGLFSQTSNDFSYNRSDDEFEAVNCYYHIDNSMRYINLTLGTTCMPFQYNTGVRYDPSGLGGADNSHYLGGSGQIAFGEGGVDDAEDPDVVLHELGHGIHDWLTNGNLSQVDGLSEGSGDYWAQSYSREVGAWTPADPEYQWQFSWDGHNPFWNGRVTNYGAFYPGGLTGAIHTDGQIWATALMRIYDIIGRVKTDKAFLEGLAMTGSNASQDDAAQAVRQAAIDMGYSCEDVDVFTSEFTYTGYTMSPLTPPSGTENSTICYGDSVIVNGNVYNASNPTGTEVIPGTTAACDSTVTINLNVLPQLASTISYTLCYGESIVVNGTTYDENNPTGTEIYPNIGTNGCDSTVTISLSFSSQISSNISGGLCDGESIDVNGTTYDAANPSGTETFIGGGVNGCDSVVYINLIPIPPITGTEASTLCDGESIVVNGTTYDASNSTGTEVFTNVGPYGCDSTVYVSLSFEAPIDVSITNNQPTLTANQTGAQYQWLDCNNGMQAINGETGQTFVAATNGSYAVEVTVGNCTEVSACETVGNVGLSAEELAYINVYPNPSDGLFAIALNKTPIDYEVTSIDGRKVIEVENVSADKIVVDLRRESKGVYFLKVNYQSKQQVFKLIFK